MAATVVLTALTLEGQLLQLIEAVTMLKSLRSGPRFLEYLFAGLYPRILRMMLVVSNP